MNNCCASKKKAFDYILWPSLLIIIAGYIGGHQTLFNLNNIPNLLIFSSSVIELANRMWWGILLGIVSVGLLSEIPKEFVIKILGQKGRLSSIIRATIAGILLDLCNHGILMIGMKLYERGASNGQVIAFLIASPWNSLSLTIILIALIGIKWTLLFILLSAIIAVISGYIFDILTDKKILPHNPNKIDLPKNFHFFKEAKKSLSRTKFNNKFFVRMLSDGIRESRMVLRWVLFGIVFASLIRTFVSTEHFSTLFAPTLAGLGLTLIAATIIEVCSEGSTPIAYDLFHRANAPGNSFAFLMTGVSTDYTEIMSIKDTAKSWKLALFLPIISLPQIIFISYILNS